ncbi:MAG: MYXO-CTERM sorting domain-containing protein [Minicystis sp.]
MPPRVLLLSIAAFTTLLAFSPAASADVPGPRPQCDAEGKGCTLCWHDFGGDPERAKAYEECTAAAKARGLVKACDHGERSGVAEYFCPPGVKVETKIVGGGCAGCAMDAGAAPDVLAAAAAGLGILALRRRRRG